MTSPAKLRSLAALATPGPWRITDGYQAAQAGRYDDDVSVIEDASGEPVIEHVYYDGHHTIVRPRDAAFIAACSPDAIVALLDRVEELEKEFDWLRKATTRIVELTPDNCDHNRRVDPDSGECLDCGTVLP